MEPNTDNYKIIAIGQVDAYYPVRHHLIEKILQGRLVDDLFNTVLDKNYPDWFNGEFVYLGREVKDSFLDFEITTGKPCIFYNVKLEKID